MVWICNQLGLIVSPLSHVYNMNLKMNTSLKEIKTALRDNQENTKLIESDQNP